MEELKFEPVPYTISIPGAQHRQAKANAASVGKTLRTWLLEAITEKLEREEGA